MNFSIQTILKRELNICMHSETRVCAQITARTSKRPLALKCLSWQSLHEFSLNISTYPVQVSPVLVRHQHPGDDGLNAHIPAHGTRTEQEWMVCPLLGSQNAHPSTEAYISCLFQVLFITNHIADALSDLSWTLARAEPCVENRTVWVFSANRVTPI